MGASKASNLLQANIYVKTLNTSAICSASNNLVSSVKDATGQTESYTYGNRQSIMTGQPTAVKDANGKTTTIGYNDYGRVSQKIFANGGKLLYTYTNGLLTSVSRTSGSSQLLGCSYDSFGNLTGVNVGSILPAGYEYAAKNGNLLEQTYGNGDSVSFAYDNLGRVMVCPACLTVCRTIIPTILWGILPPLPGTITQPIPMPMTAWDS